MKWKYGLITSMIMAMASAQGWAQEAVETLDQHQPDVMPRPSVHGPMSVVRPAGLLIASFDANNDYRITRTEFGIGAKNAFARADINGDGHLTLFELEDWRAGALGSLDAMPGNMSFDGNYNSRITEPEFLDTLIYEYDQADRDQDNIVAFNDLIRLVERPPVYDRENKTERPNRFKERKRRPGGY